MTNKSEKLAKQKKKPKTPRIEIRCDYCRKLYKTTQSAYEKSKNHYCSRRCLFSHKRGCNEIISISENIIEIILQNDEHAIVDAKNYFKILNYKWFKQNEYVVAKLNNKRILLHRLIVNCPKGLVIDHINHNTLDNRLENLNVCTQIINMRNRKGFQTNNKCNIRGVSEDSRYKGRYNVQLVVNKKKYNIGAWYNLDIANKVAKISRDIAFNTDFKTLKYFANDYQNLLAENEELKEKSAINFRNYKNAFKRAKTFYEENQELTQKVEKAENILVEIAKTIEICYQQGKIGAVAYTCLDAQKVYNLLINYKPQAIKELEE